MEPSSLGVRLTIEILLEKKSVVKQKYEIDYPQKSLK